MNINELQPKEVFENFYSLTRIPRPSKKEAQVIAFMKKFGEDLGLETIVDEAGNVIIRKPATPGYENRKGVILQAHLDMVPQKNADTVHGPNSMPYSPLLTPLHEYTCPLSLKLTKFFCSGRHCFGKDPQCPYLLQVIINPSFSQSLACIFWL